MDKDKKKKLVSKLIKNRSNSKNKTEDKNQLDFLIKNPLKTHA